MINEAKNIAQKNYIDQKIIHVIVKKFIFDDQEFFEIPDKEINYNSLEIELKFICFPIKIWKNLQESFNSNYLKILFIKRFNGGETGIRTQERVAPLPVFKTGAFNRSAILPLVIIYNDNN